MTNTNNGILQIIVLLGSIIILVKPLGLYMAFIYNGSYKEQDGVIFRVLQYIEKLIYRICKIIPEQSMNWKEYAIGLLLFSFFSFVIVYLIQRLQFFLPLNPQHFKAVSPDIAFNTAASFITNTDWQAYIGENTLSYFTDMIALTVQNFISAAVGVSVLIVLIRGLIRQETTDLGNFWVDLVRGILYIFMPLSLILALLLISQGVPQNFKNYQKYNNYQKVESVIPMGPVASQIAIKQLGTNGGGFFNANSSHPFENPTPISNFIEMLSIILIPAALCYMFGFMIKDLKQGWWLLIAMFLIVTPCILIASLIEHSINPELIKLGFDKIVSVSAGNMEGKELRFGALNSSLWAVFTTATSNGSVNSMHDSFLPIGGLIPLWLIELGGVAFGGVGSGLCQMLIFVIITVFVAGLMVGRSPEYLGKRIEAHEMKMVSFIILITPLTILICSAIAVSLKIGKAGVLNNLGVHGFTEIVYAFSSMANNNGSAFSGLNTNAFYNILGGIAMLIGRYFIVIPMLKIAGSLAKKKTVPNNLGTLSTNNLVFISMLTGIIFIMTALVFLPILSLGPIVEQLIISR